MLFSKNGAVVMRSLQFPEHSFYNLRDKILLFRHDTFDLNVLRIITSAKDVVDGTLVEVVLSGETNLFVVHTNERFVGEIL